MTLEVVRHIHKYANRRLYDTGASAYVSLQDVAALVKNGENLRVLDVKTGADITRSTLLQLLAEEEMQGKNPILSQQMLASLLTYNDDLLSGVLGNYLEATLGVFLQHSALFRAQMQDFDGDSPLDTVRELMAAQVEILRKKMAVLS